MNLEQWYEEFDEDKRLRHSKASQVEYLTTMKHFEKYFTRPLRILELGAATGAYTMALAKQQHEVYALELLTKHVVQLRKKSEQVNNVHVLQKDACDLSVFEDAMFDVVLCMGPMYHINDKQKANQCIKESIRVLKEGGLLFVAFINNDACFVSEALCYNKTMLKEQAGYEKDTFHLYNHDLVFHTIEQMKEAVTLKNSKLISMFAQDGLAEIVAEKINELSEVEFKE